MKKWKKITLAVVGLVALIGVGIWVRRSRRPGLVAWLVPFVAVTAVGVFVFLGERSRRAVPPTVGIAALVEPTDHDTAVATGQYAIYHPTSGTVTLGGREGMQLGLDAEGLEGQPRMRVQTDIDDWHWDGLALPAGAVIRFW